MIEISLVLQAYPNNIYVENSKGVTGSHFNVPTPYWELYSLTIFIETWSRINGFMLHQFAKDYK